jgi:hypothetical protein
VEGRPGCGSVGHECTPESVALAGRTEAWLGLGLGLGVGLELRFGLGLGIGLGLGLGLGLWGMGRTEAGGRARLPRAPYGLTAVSPKRLGADCDCDCDCDCTRPCPCPCTRPCTVRGWCAGGRAVVPVRACSTEVPAGMRGAGSLAGRPIGSMESDWASAGVGFRCSKGSCTDGRGMERAASSAALPGREGAREWGLRGPSPLW